MRPRSLTLAVACLALCCSGCQVSDFDLNGDGYITLDEVFTSAGDFFCGGPDSSSDDGTETPTTPDQSTTDSSSTGDPSSEM